MSTYFVLIFELVIIEEGENKKKKSPWLVWLKVREGKQCYGLCNVW